MSGPIRSAIGVAAVGNLTLAAAFVLGAPWALRLWPWETGRLSFLFLAAMLAAVGVAAAWIAVSGETGSLPAGFLNLAVTLSGVGVYFVMTEAVTATAGYVVVALAVLNLGLFFASRRLPEVTSRRIPALIRWSYVAFALVLVLVGLGLILGRDGIMPWPVDPNTSVVFGWIFLGDAFYFAYAVHDGRWGGARSQLWSFLAYDAVLLPPLVLHLPNVAPELRANLLIYLVVLGYSAGLGVYYLLLKPDTRRRISRRHAAAAPSG